MHVVSGRWRRLAAWLETMAIPVDDRERPRPQRVPSMMALQLITARDIATHATSLGSPPVLVLSLSLRTDLAALVAPHTARWTVYEFLGPRRDHHHRSRATRWMSDLIRRRESRRKRRGGRIRLVANNETDAAAWRRLHPWLPVTTIGGAVAGRVAAEPRDAARAVLGLPADETIALVFGVMHSGKDIDAVLRAFSGPDAPGRLVLAGLHSGVAMQAFRHDEPNADTSHVTVFDGVQPARVRHLLHSAADYVIVSTRPQRRNDSATLTDAVSYGLPVLCSAPYAPGDVVDRYRLGLRFPCGDAAALRDAAVAMRSFTLDPEDRERFIDSCAEDRISALLLAAVLDQDIT